MAVWSLCVCLSQVGVLSKWLNESSWFLARELLSTQIIRVSPKIRVLSSGTFSQTPNFASVYRSSKRVIVLARQDGRPERDKLDRRQSTKLTIPPSSDARLLAYHSNHKALSTAHFRRAGQLVTADTCYVVGYFLAS